MTTEDQERLTKAYKRAGIGLAVGALLWTAALMMAATFLFSVRTYSRVVIVLFLPLAVLLVTAGRVGLARLVQKVKDRDLALLRIGVLGPADAVEELLDRFRRFGVKTVRTMLARDNTLVLSFFRSQGMMAAPFIPLEMELGSADGAAAPAARGGTPR